MGTQKFSIGSGCALTVDCRADLVPVFSFGENDVSEMGPTIRPALSSLAQIFQQMPNDKGTTVYTLQKKFQNVFGFTLPLFHGRGLLNCTSRCLSPTTRPKLFRVDNLGLLPYRRRIVAVSEYLMFPSFLNVCWGSMFVYL